MQLSRTINDIFCVSVLRNEPHSGKDPSDLNIYGDIYRVAVADINPKIAHKNVGSHGGYLLAHTLELKEAPHDRCTGRSASLDIGSIAVEFVLYALDRSIQVLRHYLWVTV